jgi:hypothetical protein
VSEKHDSLRADCENCFALCCVGPLHDELTLVLEETDRLSHNSPDELVTLDVAAHRRKVNALLLRTSELVRAGSRRKKKDHRGADLTESIFLIQSQLDAANGDDSTKLPFSLSHPSHWR